MVFNLDSLAGRNAFAGPMRGVAASFLSRAFSSKARCRVVIYFEPKDISFTQVHPFLFYAPELNECYGAEVRCVANTQLIAGKPPRASHADVILLQAWFNQSGEVLERAIELLHKAHPGARISFIDSYAHNDLRLARHLEPHIDFYLKKSLFRNPEDFFRVYRGDTNLTEYYGNLYSIQSDPVDWQVPRAILPKLRLTPNFFTAARFLGAFDKNPMPTQKDRLLDIQTRFGVRGSKWYQSMRQDALERVQAIDGLKLSPTSRVSHDQYMKEMRNSKIHPPTT